MGTETTSVSSAMPSDATAPHPPPPPPPPPPTHIHTYTHSPPASSLLDVTFWTLINMLYLKRQLRRVYQSNKSRNKAGHCWSVPLASDAIAHYPPPPSFTTPLPPPPLEILLNMKFSILIKNRDKELRHVDHSKVKRWTGLLFVQQCHLTPPPPAPTFPSPLSPSSAPSRLLGIMFSTSISVSYNNS